MIRQNYINASMQKREWFASMLKNAQSNNTNSSPYPSRIDKVLWGVIPRFLKFGCRQAEILQKTNFTLYEGSGKFSPDRLR